MENEKPPIVVQETTYKGHPMLNLVYVGDGYPTTLRLGIGKAKMILASKEQIEAFYEKHKGQLQD